MHYKGWIETNFGEILTLEYGASLPETSRTGEGFSVYGSNGMVGKHKDYLVENPGIIIGRKGTVGAVVWSPDSFWPIDTTYYVKLKTNINLRFIYWYLNYLPLRSLDSSTGVPGLNRNDVYRLVVKIPDQPEEQRRIAEILDTIDETIALTSSLIAKLKQIRAGLLHDLLTRGLDEDGKLRDAIAHPEQFKDSPLGRIPKDWDVDKFEKLADAIDPQPDHRAPPEVNDGEPYIGVGDFRSNGSIDFNSCRKVSSVAVSKQQQRFYIEPGDIIFGKIGTIGLPKFLPQADYRYALNANTVLIKPRLCPSFVLWLLQSSLIERQIQIETHSTSQPAFGILRIRAMLVPIPKPEEQIKIITLLDTQESRIRREEAYLDKLKLQKKGLMHDLLTGKVRVNQI